MQNSKYLKISIGVLAMLITQISCKKITVEETVYNNTVYQVDTATIYQSSNQKTKLKSTAQFYSILFNDIFQEPLQANISNQLTLLLTAQGDKIVANQLVVSGFLNKATLPTNEAMRTDIQSFVIETYRKFYRRNPTATETAYISKLISDDPNMRVEDVYKAFILSNEYLYY
jgi:hypothetical protein